MATRLDAAAVVLAGLIVFEAVAGPALPLWKLTIQLPPIPFLLGLLALVVFVRHLAFRGTTVWDTVAVWRERLDRRPDVAAALRAFVATRPAVFLVAYFAVVTFGLAPTASRILSPDPLANLPVRFDAGWYASIAMFGYQWDGRFTKQANIAFFPALPALMQPVGQIIGSRAPGVTREGEMLRILWAGVFISLASFFVALIYLSRLSRLLVGPGAASGAPMLLAAYPVRRVLQRAVHGGAVPSRRRRRLLSLSSGAVGCRVALRAARGPEPSERMLRVRAAGDAGSAGDLLAMEERSGQGAPGLLRAPCRGPAARRGDARHRHAGVHSLPAPGDRRVVRVGRMQEAWGRTLGTRPLAQGWEWLTTEGLMAVTRGVPFDTLNTLAVLFVLAMFWSVLRRLGLAYATFVALNLFPPVFTGGALSMGRITSTLFPVFIALAARLPRQAIPVWVTAFAILQGLVATLFFTWRELF